MTCRRPRVEGEGCTEMAGACWPFGTSHSVEKMYLFIDVYRMYCSPVPRSCYRDQKWDDKRHEYGSVGLFVQFCRRAHPLERHGFLSSTKFCPLRKPLRWKIGFGMAAALQLRRPELSHFAKACTPYKKPCKEDMTRNVVSLPKCATVVRWWKFSAASLAWGKTWLSLEVLVFRGNETQILWHCAQLKRTLWYFCWRLPSKPNESVQDTLPAQIEKADKASPEFDEVSWISWKNWITAIPGESEGIFDATAFDCLILIYIYIHIITKTHLLA